MPTLSRALGTTLFLILAPLPCFACASDAQPEKAGSSPDAPDAEVLRACSDFAARVCERATSCCEGTVGTFSAEACVSAFITSNCYPAAQAVSQGVATYHPEAEEACLSALTRSYDTCVPDWEEILAIRRDVWSACRTIQGSVPAGRGCSTSAACEKPPGPGTAVCVVTTCRVLELLGEGAECPYPNGDVSVCDAGLYCTSTERDRLGVCAPVILEGFPCDPSVPLNPVCGLGSYCGPDDGICHRATNFGGGSCTQTTECVSFLCDPHDDGRSCRDAPSAAADLCASGAGSAT